MLVLLLGGTGFIGYLPVPILTAIVISALLGATEFDLAIRLWKISRTECMIFVGAFIGVLFLGTINGVLVGILLSFAEVIIRTAKPARCFLGIQPGHRHFRDLKESSQIHAVSGVLIYRFSSNLFFANIQVLRQDIEDHVTPETKAVILDASGIGSIDITAADGLDILCKSLQKQNIRFYITEHIAGLNEQLRKLGLEEEFYVASAATSSEEIWDGVGNPVYPPARAELAKHGISCGQKRAVQLVKEDYEKYDYLIGMEQMNIRNMMRILGSDPDHKVYRLLDFTDEPGDIADPWYSGKFGLTYDQIDEGVSYLIGELQQKLCDV